MQAGHWFGIAVTLVVVVAGFVASGSNSPAIWPLAGMALGSLLFGGRAAGSQRPLKPGGSNTTTEAQQPDDSADEDIHNLASSIVDAERGRD
jgi:hypothetical protein